MPSQNIEIQSPQTGIAASPHVGFADVRNLDIFSVPGIAQLNGKLVKVSSTTITAKPQWLVKDPITTTNIYALDSNGKCYISTDTGVSWSSFDIGNAAGGSTHGNGLFIWKDFLFLAKDTNLNPYGPLLSGITFTVTIASPAVFTKTGHGLAAGDAIVFSTTGALPTGLTAGTVYYVISTGLTTDDFRVSTTFGGSAVNTSGSQSGTHSYRSCDIGWKTIDSDVLWHPMFQSKNDSKLYGGAGRYVFSLEENSSQTFDPKTSATFTFTQQALDLPTNYRIKCVEELGNNLMLGTWQGTNTNDIRIADIFPWDRSSTTFGQPIVLDTFGVHAMKNVSGSLIVLAGINGMVYRCDGANAYPLVRVPVGLTGQFNFYPGAIMSLKDKVYFGIGNSSSIGGMGIYSLWQTGKGNILNLEHLNSSLTDGSAAEVEVFSLIPMTYSTFLAGCQYDGSTYGIDLSGSTYNYSTDYSGFYDSPLYIVGTSDNKRVFTKIEFQLAKELASGEGIQIQYRTNLTDSFTTVETPDGGTLSLTYSALGAVASHTFAADIPACEMIQLRVALLGSSSTTPQLRNIILS